jgi:hypothetical protein
MINEQQAMRRSQIGDGAYKVLAYVQEMADTVEGAAPSTQKGAAILLLAAASIAPDRKTFLQACRFIFDELRGEQKRERKVTTQ